MAELTADDLEQFTGGRLSASADETERLLAAALAAVRKYCGWHVTPPVEAAEVVVDGPGSYVLALPTGCLADLTEVVEDGVEILVTDLYWSELGLVRKVSGAAWTDTYGGVVVTMDHGFDSAPDWQQIVLQVADRLSLGLAMSAGHMAALPFSVSFTEPGGLITVDMRAGLEPYRLGGVHG